MKRTWLKVAVAAFFLLAAAHLGQAQTSIPEPVDSAMPPAGFVAPKPAGERDLSMAKYARESFLDGEEGIVGLHVLVRKDGSVGNVEIIGPSGSDRLDRAAQNTAKDWRYQPASVGGAAVDAWISTEIIWALQTLPFNVTREQAEIINRLNRSSAPALGPGVTTVRFLVLANGLMTKAFVDNSSGSRILDETTLKTLKTWRFTPEALANGQKVDAWFRTDIFWQGRGKEYKNNGPCALPADVSDIDTIVSTCTQFVARSDVTAYERAYAYWLRGNAYKFRNDLGKAIADYSAGIHASPGVSGIYMARGQLRLVTGQTALALSDYTAAIQVEPFVYEPYLVLGRAYMAIGLYDDGLTTFNKAIQIAPGQSETYYARCTFLAQLARAREALADCNKAVELAPRTVATLGARAYTYFRLEEYRLALGDYDAALRVDPRFAIALYGRGVMKLRLGDATGTDDLNNAKSIDPGVANQMQAVGVTPP